MPSESRGSATGTGAAVSTTTVVGPAPGPQSYLLVAVAFSVTTVNVTGITGGTGTFVLAAAINSAGKRLELWVGYNFGTSAPTQITVTRTAGTANNAVVARVLDVFADTTVAPSFTASTGTTGTGTSADSGTVTPAVGDILFAGLALGNTLADSSARAHTGNAYLQIVGTETTGIRCETDWCQAVSAVASNENWTLAASSEWAAIQVKWTPAAPPTPTSALLLKGLTTQVADAASSY